MIRSYFYNSSSSSSNNNNNNASQKYEQLNSNKNRDYLKNNVNQIIWLNFELVSRLSDICITGVCTRYVAPSVSQHTTLSCRISPLASSEWVWGDHWLMRNNTNYDHSVDEAATAAATAKPATLSVAHVSSYCVSVGGRLALFYRNSMVQHIHTSRVTLSLWVARWALSAAAWRSSTTWRTAAIGG